MRTPFLCALAAISVGGCVPPQAGPKSCTDTGRSGGFDGTVFRQPAETTPVSVRTTSAKPPLGVSGRSTLVGHKGHLGGRRERATTFAAKVERPATSVPAADTHVSAAVANFNDRTIHEQVAAAMAVAERVTITSSVPAPDMNGKKDRSDTSEAARPMDVQKTAQPNKTDLVILLMARPEINSISDLTNKIIAIDEVRSATKDRVMKALASAGAPVIQLMNDEAKALDQVISGEVSAAVLTLVSREAAEAFPDIAGFKIFRIPFSSGQRP